jgi:hypothetical protein
MSRFGTKEAQLTNALVAMVPLGPAHDKPADVRATSRPHADFVAHLIATAEQAPQTCARRRLAPREANAIYRSHDQAPAVTGRALSRSL